MFIYMLGYSNWYSKDPSEKMMSYVCVLIMGLYVTWSSDCYGGGIPQYLYMYEQLHYNEFLRIIM